MKTETKYRLKFVQTVYEVYEVEVITESQEEAEEIAQELICENADEYLVKDEGQGLNLISAEKIEYDIFK